MSVHPNFDHATPVDTTAELPPVFLSFERLSPRELASFQMHDRRSGGDLAHVDWTKTPLNRVEFGREDWAPKLTRRIGRMAERNLRNELRALRAKGRHAQAARRQAEGPKPPWHANTDAPLREGLLTVNKLWFGGAGVDMWERSQVATFRRHAMEFLRENFPAGQLLYAASHSDEEAFHIHFVIAIWDRKVSKGRGQQILLRASAHRLCQSYEHAQDLAGEHFSKIGIRRGERRAEARRLARASGSPVPPMRRHIPPSEYRAHERRKGKADAAKITEAAVNNAALIQDDAQDMGAMIIRKCRKHVTKEAERRRAKAQRLAKAAEARRNHEERDTQAALAAAATARRMEQRAHHAAAAFIEKAQALHVEVAHARAELDCLAKEAAEARQAAAEARAQKDARTSQAEAIASGIEYLADGVISYRTASGDRPPRLGFTSIAPPDREIRRYIVEIIRPAAGLLNKISRHIHRAVDAILVRERAQIAEDAQTLAAVREEMGIGRDESLDDVRARYADASDDMSGPTP